MEINNFKGLIHVDVHLAQKRSWYTSKSSVIPGIFIEGKLNAYQKETNVLLILIPDWNPTRNNKVPIS